MALRDETLVIGAGPAGLAAAACLRRLDVPLVMVDQAAGIGSSWRGHYERLHLHTDAGHSALPYFGFPPGTPRYPSRAQMVAYLDRYAQHFGLNPNLGEEVKSVSPCDKGWITRTTGSVYHSRRVIVATGYNSVPHMPAWPGQERFAGRILHSSAYRNGEEFRGQRVLVIGFGNSGGELAIDLHEHGAQVAMAVRGPVNIVPREVLGIPILTIALALSHLPARVADALAAPLARLTVGDLTKLGLRRSVTGPITQIRTTSRVPLIDIGTMKLIREGHIEVLGGVHSMSATGVRLDDGSQRCFDAIIAATGFRPGVDRFLNSHYDDRRMHHAPPHRDPGESGLYFCGLRFSPTGMLREIGIEAQRIAGQIKRAR